MSELQEISCFYSSYMRPSLFTAFVTMGSFLLTSKVFLVTNVRSMLTDERYQELVKAFNKQEGNGKEKTKVTDPLLNLAKQFGTNITLAFATSACQFTIGMINHWVAAVICLAIAFVTMIFTFQSVYELQLWVVALINHEENKINNPAPKKPN